MNNLAKHLFQLVLLFVIAFTLGAPQRAGSFPCNKSATLSTQTNPGSAYLTPGATVDPSGVIFFSKEQVSQTSLKGGMLYNGNPDHNYRAMILRRDKPGEVEVHTKDTDLFYIIEGSATFATGGTIVSGKDTAPDEIRGTSMNGGVTRKLSPGEVLIIPANVSHWFKEIQTPVTYFTVKVR